MAIRDKINKSSRVGGEAINEMYFIPPYESVIFGNGNDVTTTREFGRGRRVGNVCACVVYVCVCVFVRVYMNKKNVAY